MEKYIIGYSLLGYNNKDVTDPELLKEQSELIIVLDKESNSNLKDYYKLISCALRMNSKVILIGVEGKTNIFKPLASLMTSYRNYNIYNVISSDMITPTYISKIEDRTPDFNEVQSFIGGDIAAYSDLSMMMFGIENLVKEGNTQGLSVFLEQHMASLESLTSSLDYMKSICELYRTDELTDKINNLEESILRHKDDSARYISKVKELTEENGKISSDLDKLKKDIETLRDKNNQLKEASESASGGIISNFSELNTAFINCKTSNILYFKEVSYVPYMNTLINNLMTIFTTKKIRVKLLIYDNKTELYQVYKPLTVVDGKTYLSSKELFIKKTDRFVISEPSQAIINDILTVDPGFDVLIVYDRLKTPKDIVIGNNVTKFFVINSKADFEKLTVGLNIVDESRIITRSDSTFSPYALDIPYVDKYKGGTPSAKAAKYMRLTTSISKKNLVNTICETANIELK